MFQKNSSAWKILPFLAIGFFVWCTALRVQQVLKISRSGPDEAIVDPTTATGYKGGRRWMVIPGNNIHSFQWIAETQQMFAQNESRVRHVDYENAPFGRAVYSPSPYRWWLGIVAWTDHRLLHHSLGLSVERAALIADPLLHLFMCLATIILAVRWHGWYTATALSLGLTTFFPFLGAFLPGTPDSSSLILILLFWSVFPLMFLARNQASLDPLEVDRQSNRCFLFVGFIGGLGLWVSVGQQSAVLLGIALGGIAAIRSDRKNNSRPSVPAESWRLWALGGAVTSLAGYLLEYFPHGLDWRPQENHPIYPIAWLGIGEFMAQFASPKSTGKVRFLAEKTIRIFMALAAIAALPIALLATKEYLVYDFMANRLINLRGDISATSLISWVRRDGLNGDVLLTCLPVVLVIPFLVHRAYSRIASPQQRIALLLVAGPMLVLLVCACLHLREWCAVDAIVLCAAAMLTIHSGSMATPFCQSIGASSIALVSLCGLIRFWPVADMRSMTERIQKESVGLAERNIAYWIADRASPEGAVLLAPPFSSASLVYYGGLRGLGSPAWENRDGVAATILTVSAVTPEQASARLNQREVTHIILPSWDRDLDEFVRASLARPEDSLLAAIRRWGLPTFLRPLAYTLPESLGIENGSVLIIQVTNESNQWAFLSRQAEYFLEIGCLDLAKRASNALKLYPTNPSALAARVQIEKASEDATEFNAAFNTLRDLLKNNPGINLQWDRRVSVAIALALGGETDLSREQTKLCLREVNQSRIRDLSAGALYRFLFLSNLYRLQFQKSELREYGLNLLSLSQRKKLE